MTKITRYSVGGITQKHRGKNITTSVGSTLFDQYTKDIINLATVREGLVPTGYENRPDLIADLFYNSSTEWWKVMLLNNIPDPFEGFNLYDKILLPD